MNGHVRPYEGVDLTVAEGDQVSASISWHDPHPIFVIILVGEDEEPFGIQKDLLCAQSPYYRDEFVKAGAENKIELIVKLPEYTKEVFGCFQCFVYTGKVYDKANGTPIPEYPLLLRVWKLATHLRMAPLRVAVLDVMAERRLVTGHIPGAQLLIQSWELTEEGSGLRKMLIEWAAEHMRTSPDIRNTFAKSLPREILSELVIVMSDLPAAAGYMDQSIRLPSAMHSAEVDHADRPSVKRTRKSEVLFINNDEQDEAKVAVKKQARRPEPIIKKPNRRSLSQVEPIPMGPDKEMNYCRDLITRMMSGPGYWTRLVGPFKFPVDPVAENVPNYFDVVKRPMDLRTIHNKMSRGDYHTAAEFEADVRQIFQNCYEYWTENDKPFKDCLAFESYFNSQWANRHTWKPSVKAEVIE